MTSLERMEDAWRIRPVPDVQEQQVEEDEEQTSVLQLLKVTVEAIRAVRAWSLALPPSATGSSTNPGLHKLASTTPVSKPRISSISTPSRPAPTPTAGSRSVSGILASGMKSEESAGSERRSGDPSAEVRRSALDVLVCLRSLEERFREIPVEGDSSVEEEPRADLVQRIEGGVNPERRGSDVGESEDLWIFTERTDTAQCGMTVDEGDRRTWYDRLATSGGYVYRAISAPEDVEEEVPVISKYLQTVRRTLFPGCDAGSPWRLGERRGAEDREKEDVFGGPSDASGGHKGKEIPEWADSARWENKQDRESSECQRNVY